MIDIEKHKSMMASNSAEIRIKLVIAGGCGECQRMSLELDMVLFNSSMGLVTSYRAP